MRGNRSTVAGASATTIPSVLSWRAWRASPSSPPNTGHWPGSARTLRSVTPSSISRGMNTSPRSASLTPAWGLTGPGCNRPWAGQCSDFRKAHRQARSSFADAALSLSHGRIKAIFSLCVRTYFCSQALRGLAQEIRRQGTPLQGFASPTSRLQGFAAGAGSQGNGVGNILFRFWGLIPAVHYR